MTDTTPGPAPRCDVCSNCVLEDYGYSNYTVEGTYVHCALRLLPEQGFDRWYGEDARLAFAETCPSFMHGDPVRVDVDHEEDLSPSDVAKCIAAGVRTG